MFAHGEIHTKDKKLLFEIFPNIFPNFFKKLLKYQGKNYEKNCNLLLLL